MTSVAVHLSSSQFEDGGDCPQYEDDRCVYFPALFDDEEIEGSPYELLKQEIEDDKIDTSERHFFVLDASEPTFEGQIEAIKRYLA